MTPYGRMSVPAGKGRVKPGRDARMPMLTDGRGGYWLPQFGTSGYARGAELMIRTEGMGLLDTVAVYYLPRPTMTDERAAEWFRIVKRHAKRLARFQVCREAF